MLVVKHAGMEACSPERVVGFLEVGCLLHQVATASRSFACLCGENAAGQFDR